MSEKSDLNLWIEDFLKKRKYSKYELELAGNSAKGDGYLGDVSFVKVLTGIGRDEEKIYNLVVKSAKKGDELRKQTPVREVFEREMFMYSTVFPAFRTFQLKHNLQNPFMKFAKCYSVFNENHREAIILQNLKYLEYEVYDRKRSQNLDHVLLTFKNYAKFHAISLAMKRQNPRRYDELTENMSDLLAKFVLQANMIEGLMQAFDEAVDLLKGNDDVAYKKLSSYDISKVKNILWKDKNPTDGISVILHGDCWNNNMMFSYSDSSKKQQPSDVMFLDFQLSSPGSPIYDLSYYLYAVADEQVLKYYDLLLQTYHYTLTRYLAKLNEHSYQITLEDLKRHWREYGIFGLILAPFVLKIELSEDDEVVDWSETAESGQLSGALNVKIKNRDAFEARAKAAFKHYASLIKN